MLLNRVYCRTTLKICCLENDFAADSHAEAAGGTPHHYFAAMWALKKKITIIITNYLTWDKRKYYLT